MISEVQCDSDTVHVGFDLFLLCFKLFLGGFDDFFVFVFVTFFALVYPGRGLVEGIEYDETRLSGSAN